jgi:hypothetical protein
VLVSGSVWDGVDNDNIADGAVEVTDAMVINLRFLTIFQIV